MKCIYFLYALLYDFKYIDVLKNSIDLFPSSGIHIDVKSLGENPTVMQLWFVVVAVVVQLYYLFLLKRRVARERAMGAPVKLSNHSHWPSGLHSRNIYLSSRTRKS